MTALWHARVSSADGKVSPQLPPDSNLLTKRAAFGQPLCELIMRGSGGGVDAELGTWTLRGGAGGGVAWAWDGRQLTWRSPGQAAPRGLYHCGSGQVLWTVLGKRWSEMWRNQLKKKIEWKSLCSALGIASHHPDKTLPLWLRQQLAASHAGPISPVLSLLVRGREALETADVLDTATFQGLGVVTVPAARQEGAVHVVRTDRSGSFNAGWQESWARMARTKFSNGWDEFEETGRLIGSVDGDTLQRKKRLYRLHFTRTSLMCEMRGNATQCSSEFPPQN
ncbi:hypothetical protein EGW08_018160 [Elysia chlorotica]|uniref:Uncharacterized protein n=1 Tax=Elysia chlorotica TaxID=188477 RepID=A0A433SXQ5_ELYCH|nr:hypothetical protein EGW08_018160 [Elysia chlorotica]